MGPLPGEGCLILLGGLREVTLKPDVEARATFFQIERVEASGVSMRRPGGLKVFVMAKKAGCW